MTDLITRIRTIATSLVGYLIVAQVIAQTLIIEYGDTIPIVGQYGGQVLAAIGGIILVVRRVTPAAATDRGLLP